MKKLYTIKSLCPSEKTLDIIRMFAHSYRPTKGGSTLIPLYTN